MSYTADPKENQSNKSSVTSGVVNKDLAKEVMGGYPAKKTVEEIDRQNSPAGRKRAPGSVRV